MPNAASVTPVTLSCWSGSCGTIDRSAEAPQLTHLCSIVEDNEANYALDIKHKLRATDFVHIADCGLG